MPALVTHRHDSIVEHLRGDYVLLKEGLTLEDAIDEIRRKSDGDSIAYFYVVDSDERLVGVVPTRRLLSGAPTQRIGEIMLRKVIAIPDRATVVEACEFFALHKFLAFPVVDGEKRVVGVVDVSLYAEEAFNYAERRETDALFEAIGFRLRALRGASPWTAFRLRFPWLLATIAGGTACALLAGAYGRTIAESLVLAFFLALVLGLGESVSTQSMTIAIQTLRSRRPTARWFRRAFMRELATSALLGIACSVIVMGIVLLYRSDVPAALTIGASIALSIVTACLIGLSVPSFLHAWKLDPRIASGPLTLALADIATLAFYFTVGMLILGDG